MTDEGGHYFFKGRKKDAMRRRGENIPAREVERVVNAAPGVEESAVIGVDSELGEEITALVKLREGGEPDAIGLVKFCAERLAYYQVPRFIQFVDEFLPGAEPAHREARNQARSCDRFRCRESRYKANACALTELVGGRPANPSA